MSQILSEVLESNRAYVASFGSKSSLRCHRPAAFAILTWLNQPFSSPNANLRCFSAQQVSAITVEIRRFPVLTGFE